MEKTFVWEAILMPQLHVLLYFWPKKGPVFVPLILEDVCGKTMTDPHSVMQLEGRDFKFYNMLQHTFNKVNIVKVFTPHSQFVCFPNSSEVRVLLHNPGALELRAWTEATEITPFLDQIISLSQVGINVIINYPSKLHVQLQTNVQTARVVAQLTVSDSRKLLDALEGLVPLIIPTNDEMRWGNE